MAHGGMRLNSGRKPRGRRFPFQALFYFSKEQLERLRLYSEKIGVPQTSILRALIPILEEGNLDGRIVEAYKVERTDYFSFNPPEGGAIEVRQGARGENGDN